MKVGIKKLPHAQDLPLPHYATKGSAGLDLLAAIDEEVTFQGVQHHIRNHSAYDLGVAGEPTSLAVVSACKGVIRFVIDVHGRGAHSARPEEGVDALIAFMREFERRHG